MRLLSHDNATKVLIRSLPSILVSLDREASENGEPTAHGGEVLLVFCYCIYLMFSLTLVASKIFQKKDVDLRGVKAWVSKHLAIIIFMMGGAFL